MATFFDHQRPSSGHFNTHRQYEPLNAISLTFDRIPSPNNEGWDLNMTSHDRWCHCNVSFTYFSGLRMTTSCRNM